MPLQVQGEPYDLTGRRLLFTSWYYVRPGSFAWLDEQGKNVTVKGSQGPWDARFSRRDYPHGIRLAAQPAIRSGPLIKPERPWEEQGVSFDTLIYDEGRFRAWGRCASAKGQGFFAYFESKDGWHWERPELGLVEFEGSRKRFAVGYALWPKGRLVGLEAPDQGEFATVAIIPPGRTLWINALTQRAGSILIEAANAKGAPLSGRTFVEAMPVVGDQHWTQVRWKEASDLGLGDGEALILRFQMERSAIFGLEFR